MGVDHAYNSRCFQMFYTVDGLDGVDHACNSRCFQMFYTVDGSDEVSRVTLLMSAGNVYLRDTTSWLRVISTSTWWTESICSHANILSPRPLEILLPRLQEVYELPHVFTSLSTWSRFSYHLTLSWIVSVLTIGDGEVQLQCLHCEAAKILPPFTTHTLLVNCTRS